METHEEIEFSHVCQQLDVILNDFFQTLKQLLVTRQELDKRMKDGFFLMARARYSMGVKSVSSTQYNADDLQKAFSSVNVMHSSDGFISFQPELILPKARIHATGIVRNSKEAGLLDEEGSECVELEQIKNEVLDVNREQEFSFPSGLRRRNVEKEPNGAVESPAVSNDISGVEKVISGVERMTCDGSMTEEIVLPPSSASSGATVYGKDPILWFGVLVPQPLRQSQTAFKSAIELLCEVAALQNRLVQQKALYEEKMTMKRQLMVLCKKSDFNKITKEELDHLQENSPADCPDDE